MCGITGYYNFSNHFVSPKIIKNMNDMLSHRGPDGDGVWVEQNIGLGHRRLSIIDLSDTASQPMSALNGRFVITYNGEIYNYIELKRQLEKLGHVFFSKSDTEVVLNSLIEWGIEAIPKFNGMFSFAFFDRSTKDLIIARDRYGIKPLYYYSSDSKLIFASEQKAISHVHEHTTRLDYQGFVEYLTFQNIFTDRTLNRDIQILKSGHYLKVNGASGKLDQYQYWDYNFSEKIDGSDEEIEEEVLRLFEQAVKRQLVSDVEVGSYLSGGIDSGSIAAIAAKENTSLKTFTCGFDLKSAAGLELAFDERLQASMISKHIGSQQYEMELKSGDMESCFKNLVYAIEEPRVGQSYPNYYAAQLASKHVKVVLSGAGGDEIFGGYPWRYFSTAGATNFDEYVNEYFAYWQRMLTRDEIKLLCRPILQDINDIDTKQIFQSILNGQEQEEYSLEQGINNSLYFEAKTFMHGLLVVEDKLSMAHSLETRLPFLDNDLVDFGMKIKVSQKISNLSPLKSIDENDLVKKYYATSQKTSNGKKVLRKAMSNFLPENVTNAVKRGFSGPDASWFKGESMKYVNKSLKSKQAPLYQYLDYSFTNQLLDEHLYGQKNRRLLIWSLLSLNELMMANF